MEQMDCNLLLRWFVGLGIDDPVWVPTVFGKNRDRLLTTDMSRKVMAAILVVTPHVAQETRHTAIDKRSTNHPGYALLQRCRKKIEEPFGWADRRWHGADHAWGC